MSRKIILLFVFAFLGISASAQRVIVKNNVAYDALLTPNLGLEIGLGKSTSLDITGNYNPFVWNDGKSIKHWLVQPEFRYWLCERFNGHFFGLHALGGEFNISKVKLPFGMAENGKNSRYDGYYLGGGISYGYQWMFSKRWGLEGTVGLGYIRANYDQYRCRDCSPKIYSGHKNYFGPTKLGLSLTYMIY